MGLKLDLACGASKRSGFSGVDIVPLQGVDFVHDLNIIPWPFKDDSVEEAYCSHYVEHVQNLPAFFDELYRVLKPGGKCLVICPYYTSIASMQDPFHVRPISELTFLYYNKTWRQGSKIEHYPIKADFDLTYGFVYYQEWESANEKDKAFAVKHYNNVVSEVQVVMTKR